MSQDWRNQKPQKQSNKKEERHRVFLSVKVSAVLQEEILEWEKKLKGEFNEIPIRWIAPENLHITLVPPWNEEDVSKVIKGIDKLQGVIEPFEVSFHTVNFGPGRGKPRLIWAEGELPDALATLSSRLEKKLKLPRSKRPFKLHLTLARFNPADFWAFPKQHLGEPIDWQQKVESFVLMKSYLLPSGAEYEVLHEVGL